MLFGYGVTFVGALLHALVAVSIAVGRDEDTPWHGASRLIGWLLIAIGTGALTVHAIT